MSDFVPTGNNDDEIDAILNEVKSGTYSSSASTGNTGSGSEPASDGEKSGKEWSMEDIDRLIAETQGGEYVPSAPVSSAPAESGFDSGLFSVRPIEEEAAPEMEDISSGETEVDGQETFFEEPEEFDIDSFELEAIEVPEDDGAPAQTGAEIFTSDEEEIHAFTDTSAAAQTPAAEPEEPEEEKIVDYRERFYKKMTLEDIGAEPEEPEPEGPVDKSGTLVVKSEEDEAEPDLEPMPTVMAAEELKNRDSQKTKIAASKAETQPAAPDKDPDDVEGQIVLTEFTETPDENVPEQALEGDIESNLWKRRKKKAEEFKLDDLDEEFSDELERIDEEAGAYVPEEEKEEDIPAVVSLVEAVGEYESVEDRNRIHTRLASRMKRTTSGLVVIGIIEAVLLLLALLPSITHALNIETSIFRAGGMPLCIVNAVLIVAAVVFDGGRFFDSFTGMFKGRFNGDTACALAVAVALIENTLSAITGADAPVFGAIAVVGILINKVTDAINAGRVYHNFQVCAFNYDNDMYAVHPFENENEIFELGRGLLMGNAEMLYSSNVIFPTGFIKNSESASHGDRYLKFMLLISGVVSLAVGIAVGIKQSFMGGAAAFTAAFCLSLPVFGKFIPEFITYIYNRSLNHEGTMIVSLDAAERTAAANAVVLDSADIFDRKSCTMHGMKDFDNMRIDTVLLYAAALVIKSGGPLKDCFEAVVDGRQDLLPPVRELVYEDKMGISARIYEQKALLGNRNMLVHHNITAPDKKFEDKYAHDGRKIIYLAVNEKLAAMFVVSYRVDEEMKRYLRTLEKNGIQTLVRTNDVNVTEELVSERFDINPGNFKILSSVASRLYKRRKDTVSETLEAGVIHDGRSRSMLKAIAACCAMNGRSKLGTLIQFVLMAAGAALTVLAGFGENGITAAAAIGIFVLETAACIIALTPFKLLRKRK